jgi:GNAT superfamily N-acetyltransferase
VTQGVVEAVTIREARESDLAGIVALHEADSIGKHGDCWADETAPRYRKAFAVLAAHPDHHVFVAEMDGRVVGSFILSLLPGLTGQGATHAELRSVQVDHAIRSQGIGAKMVAFAEDRARTLGATSMQLTSNLKRIDAHRFYERLGYAKSHAGFKKTL